MVWIYLKQLGYYTPVNITELLLLNGIPIASEVEVEITFGGRFL